MTPGLNLGSPRALLASLRGLLGLHRMYPPAASVLAREAGELELPVTSSGKRRRA